MGTLHGDDDAKRELDDSGCVQDESLSSKKAENGYVGQAGLLDLSDDVLLYILRHCSPQDLKALGYTCPRLGSLILDHTLWQRVDARSQPSGRSRVRWLLTHALNAGTKELSLSGYAKEAKGCLGHVNRTREETHTVQHKCDSDDDVDLIAAPPDNEGDQNAEGSPRQEPPYPLLRQHARLHFAETLPRFTGTPSWPDELSDDNDLIDAPTHGCGGPVFTLNQCILSQLRSLCTELSELRLEYCNINCKTTSINQFPSTLRKLSLRGAKCYNLPLDRSFLFRISDYLPHLEFLDVSECEWLEPASLLPISKMTSLQELLMRHCYKLSEFVAYASLACRYGFTNLKILDLSGSPVGDSEVSAFGWVEALQELYLRAAPPASPAPPHKHYKGDPLSPHRELDGWEKHEPEYFRIKQTVDQHSTSPETSGEDLDEQIEILRRRNSLHPDHSDLDRRRVMLEKESFTVRLTVNQPEVVQEAQPEVQPERQPQLREPELRLNAPSSNAHVIVLKRISQPELPSENASQDPQEEHHPENTNPENSHPEEPPPENAIKRKQENGDLEPGPSKRKKTAENTTEQQNGKRKDSESDSDSEDENPKRIRPDVNQGASTSKSPTPKEQPKLEQYVRFRQNQDPVIVQCPAPQQVEAEPRQHILYVNVGQQLRAIYRLMPGQNRQPDTHVDSASLVTDSAVRRFGRADGEDINYVHIGPNGPLPGRLREHGRPNRSNLRVLSIRGYRHITDRSLVHLATAAPNLTSVDFSGSSVTDRGARAFTSIRPDCRLVYSSHLDE